jgi:hypothetical protein
MTTSGGLREQPPLVYLTYIWRPVLARDAREARLTWVHKELRQREEMTMDEISREKNRI